MVTRLRRDVHVPLYWLIVGLAVMVVSPILSILVSVKINAATIAKNEAAKAEIQQQVRAENLVRYCRLVGAQIDVYNEAQTEVGRSARRVWLEEYITSGCQPPRE